MIFYYEIGFPFLNNPKNLDLSYKIDLDYLDCFEREKISYNGRNLVQSDNSKLWHSSFSLPTVLSHKMIVQWYFVNSEKVIGTDFLSLLHRSLKHF